MNRVKKPKKLKTVHVDVDVYAKKLGDPYWIFGSKSCGYTQAFLDLDTAEQLAVILQMHDVMTGIRDSMMQEIIEHFTSQIENIDEPETPNKKAMH